MSLCNTYAWSTNWYNKWLPHEAKAALNMSSIVWIGCSTAAASGTSAAAAVPSRAVELLAGPVELLAGPVEVLAGAISGGGRVGSGAGSWGGSWFTGSVTVKSLYKYLCSEPLASPSNIFTLT